MKVSTMIATRLTHLRNERLDRAGLERQQLRRFRRLAAYVQKHSPFYRDVMAERRIDARACTPLDFPVLTKTELMRSFDRISTDPRVRLSGVKAFLERSRDPFDLYQDEFYVLHSSGSSGEAGISVFSKADWTRGVVPGLRFTPLLPKRQRLVFFGVTSGHFAGVSFALTCRRFPLSLLYDVRTYGIDAPLPQTVMALNSFQPHIVQGYSSALGMLAERQKAGELHIHPSSVQCSGEAVLPADRALVQDTFGVPLVNVFSCTEHLVSGYGRPEFGGMCLFEDDRIFELMPDHILVTNTFNYTLPLIRYRMGDIMSKAADPKPLFPFRKITEAFGRSEQIPHFRNAAGEVDFISPHSINELLIPYVRRFQLVVRSNTSCVFRVCLEEGLTDQEKKAALADAQSRLREVLHAKDMDNVGVSLEAVSELAVDPGTGKFRLIIQEE